MIDDAIDKYVEFHQYEPTDIGEFPSSFSIPQTTRLAGSALFVLYRSRKKDPTTLIEPEEPLDYIHEHKAGVFVYGADGDGPRKRVPAWIKNTASLIKLGECLGFAYLDGNGSPVEKEGIFPYPELYSIPSGKALLVIEDKKRIAAFIWGGKLRVESRGIIG